MTKPDNTEEAVAWRWKPADDPNDWRHGGFDPRRYWESLLVVEPLFPLSSLETRDARIAELDGENAKLRDLSAESIRLMSKYAREAGEATGKLETSELAGIVDDWKARAIKAETALEWAVKALGQINRMTLFYDAAINQITLSSAIQIARATLAAIREDAA